MIFRKVALERLSSPEQLDQLMQVTNPRGWLSLAALGALILTALIWGVTGAIPTEALGQGILIRRGGVADVVTTGQGQVEEVRVAVGDLIEKGQVVVTLRQDELLRQIAESQAQLGEVREEYEALVRYSTEQRRLQVRNRAQERVRLERTIQSLNRDIEILQERIGEERTLLADGLITKQTLLSSEQELNSTQDRLAGKQLELDGLELSRLEAEQLLDEQIETRDRQVQELERSVQDLEAKLEDNANVVSQYEGRLLELTVNRGDVVNPGTPVLKMEVASEELMAVLFVPATSGKQVQPGMPARIAPSTVKREEYGYMQGNVAWVAEFPSTSRGMMRLLANQDLVTKLVAEGPLIQVDVTLIRQPETPTGYEWSSSRGPDLTITSGTLASGSVIVREDRPIHLVIPKVRAKLGI